MTMLFAVAVVLLLLALTLAAYADRVYFEQGKFLSREYTENIDAWERLVEPRLKLSRESATNSASMLRQVLLATLAFLFAIRLHSRAMRSPAEIGAAVLELVLVLLLFDRFFPQIFFIRTRGTWAARWTWLFQLLFYLVLPLTLALGLLLSIASLAEPEEMTEPEHPSEAMDALLEAGEEEGIFEADDRELVRSVVAFGDKVVREVMTPRPEMFAVPDTMTLEEFTAEINAHSFSRVPVYAGTMDVVTGIAFARDLLQVRDEDARSQRVTRIQRAAEFVPETKKVNVLLREMQREQQHMRIVIDEYGGVAGLVTIEDLIEAIVGEIEDEHDAPTHEDAPVADVDGTFLVPGGFEVSRLRALFEAATPETGEESIEEPSLPELLTDYEATTVGGLVSEIAGHIPLPGEVVEDGPLRMEVVASSDRLVERVRVGLARAMNAAEPE